MRYCKKCVMPETRPGITFNKDGVCSACVNYENRKNIDWNDRWNKLLNIANRYRRCNGSGYDCVIAASSGKDSYFQTYIFKEVLKMNPLLVSVDNFTWTDTGRHNWNNLLKRFNVDAITMSISPETCKKMLRKGLDRGIPTWFLDCAIYTYPINMATKLNIPLVVYGESINYEYGGKQNIETHSAKEQLYNDVVKQIPLDEWVDDDICIEDLACLEYPDIDDITNVGLSPIYLSYFIPWSGFENMLDARKWGFRTLDDTGEWKRDGFIEQYDQIDSVGYVVHSWFKFPKFGHFRVTDVASTWIREGRITRKEAVDMVISEDWKLDKKMLYDFLRFTGIDERYFWKIVDRYVNTDILEKRNGNWRLKRNVEYKLRNP